MQLLNPNLKEVAREGKIKMIMARMGISIPNRSIGRWRQLFSYLGTNNYVPYEINFQSVYL